MTEPTREKHALLPLRPVAMGGVLIGVDRPPLAAALVARGVPLWLAGTPDAVVAPADSWRSVARGAHAFVLAENDVEAAAAIDAGADDAASHATADVLIAARLAAWLERRSGVLTIGDLTIDTERRRARRGDRDLRLLPREFAVLLDLARRAPHPVSRADLLRRVWNLGFDPGTNVIQVHISRLRTKLDHGFTHAMLRTEKRVGYCLVEPAG